MFKVYEIRYSIDATKLRRLRRRLAVKQSTFARACGWSRSYQQKLENGKVITVSEATKNVVLAVIEDLESAALKSTIK